MQVQTLFDLQKGARLRRWDGCMLRDFALVASGETFHQPRSDRLRHRFYRKDNTVEVIRLTLESAGYQVISAADGAPPRSRRWPV